jgi:hypothetical protein
VNSLEKPYNTLAFPFIQRLHIIKHAIEHILDKIKKLRASSLSFEDQGQCLSDYYPAATLHNGRLFITAYP